MHRIAPLLLLLAACATSPPRSYRQAAPAYVEAPAVEPSFPHPGYTPAGAGLPGERMPGQPGPEVPHSKNWRPAGAHPELMAPDDAPQASGSKVHGAQVMDVMLPVPDLDDLDWGRHLAEICASDIRDALKRGWSYERRAMLLSMEERACLFAEMYRWCFEERLDRAAGVDSRTVSDLGVMLSEATKFREQKCTEKTMTERVRYIVRGLREQAKREPK